MTVDHRQFYESRAAEYDALVAAEDADGRLAPALADRVPLAGADVLEIGVGTGRLTRLLAGAGARVVGCEPAAAMLAVARRHLAALPGASVELHQATARAFDVGERRFDLALAGWVFGHFVSWLPSGWRDEIGASLERMESALRPGGALVVIETLGTGLTEPAPPTPGLAEYYAWLESERGMRRTALRTDYAFAGVEEAAQVTGAFFGEDFAARVRQQSWSRVPECTGLWWRTVAG